MKLDNTLFDTYTAAISANHEFKELHEKTILITGGTGFFGAWLLSLFYQLNKTQLVNVVVVSRNPDRFLNRYQQYKNKSWLRFIKKEILQLTKIDLNVDFVIHAAAGTSISDHEQHYTMLHEIIQNGDHIIKKSTDAGVEKLLIISSGAVYGKQPADTIKVSEGHSLACSSLDPFSAYGEGKRCIELFGAIASKTSHLHVTSARCFTFSGAGLPLNQQYALGNFVYSALFEKQLHITGNGKTIRSYLHGADLAAHLLLVLLKGERCEAYNIGSGEPVTIKELAEKVRDLLSPGKKIYFAHTEKNTENISRYLPDITKVKTLGAKETISLESSILNMADYARISQNI